MNDNKQFKQSVAIIGIMGSGKSSFGKKLAKKGSVKFFDLDEMIKIKTDYSPKEIFNYFGHNALKTIEFEILKELLQQPVCVISTGDSTIDNEKAWELLKQNTITLWLNVSLRLVSTRLRPNEDRPYLNIQTNNLFDFVQKLYQERLQLYKQAHIKINQNLLMQKNFLKKILELIYNLQNKNTHEKK